MWLNVNHALDRHGSADVACVERSATQGVSRLQNYACSWPLAFPLGNSLCLMRVACTGRAHDATIE
jgi:hypothetical protein